MMNYFKSGKNSYSEKIVGQGGGALRSSAVWWLLALISCLYVFVLNGGILFYYDTTSYLGWGTSLVAYLADAIGLPANEVSPPVEGLSSIISETKSTTASTEEPAVFSRSRVFSLVMGLFARLNILEGIVVLNACIVVASVALPVRVFARSFSSDLPVARAVAISLLVASLGSLPFYVAYLMPDIFTPVLLLVIATLTAFSNKMNWMEITFAFALGAFAMLTHASNIAITMILLPAVGCLSLVVDRKRRFVAPIFVLLLVGLGVGEQSAFRTAFKSRLGNEVLFLPHLTARLIADEVGFDFLTNNCPDNDIQTCVLFDALSKSSDPMRLTASNIVFHRSPELGSFRLMSSEDKAKVAQNQVRFFSEVLSDYPVRTIVAFLKNIAAQIKLNSVAMTLQSLEIVRKLDGVSGLAVGEFREGYLTKDLFWLKPANTAHQVLYMVSFVVALTLLFLPRILNGRSKTLIIMIGLGVLANAFVMGGVSQPAARYGSRVIWLLPLAAMLSIFFSSFVFGPSNASSSPRKRD